MDFGSKTASIYFPGVPLHEFYVGEKHCITCGVVCSPEWMTEFGILQYYVLKQIFDSSFVRLRLEAVNNIGSLLRNIRFAAVSTLHFPIY